MDGFNGIADTIKVGGQKTMKDKLFVGKNWLVQMGDLEKDL